MLSIKLKIIVLTGIIFLLLAYPMSCVISNYTYRDSQIDRLIKNVPKIKEGMTYQEVYSLIGYPHFIFYSTDEDIKNFKKADLMKSYFIEPEIWRDSKTKSGEINWFYFYGPDTSKGSPMFSFDSVTGRLTRLSSKFFDP